MIDMEKRREKLLELLDTSLSYVEDNPIHEYYNSRNILNYLKSIQTIDQIMAKKEN